jgi:hypothetical protein
MLNYYPCYRSYPWPSKNTEVGTCELAAAQPSSQAHNKSYKHEV